MENPCFRFAEDAVATFRFAVRLFWGLTDLGPSILITAIVLKRPTRGISIHRVRTPLTLRGRPVAICLDGRPPLDTGRTGHCTGRTRRTPRVVSDISTRDRSANPQAAQGPSEITSRHSHLSCAPLSAGWPVPAKSLSGSGHA